MTERRPDASGGSFGRLRSGPDPVLWETLYAPSFESDRRHTLPWLLEVDAAHVTMLAETGILPRPQAAELLRLNRELALRCRRGETVLDPPPGHRGLFLAYENLFIDRLGREVGGAAHVARSRNDINATIARLRLRTGLLALLDELVGLLGAAADLAAEHAETAMSGFTHLQPAQPTTFGHYVTAVLSELERGAGRVLAGYDETNRSPLGAGAGLGTSFPIDRERTAAGLGFDGVI
ncbi:MAG TPA: lyase family protein, partial [Thermoanaerobaculia bacterium]